MSKKYLDQVNQFMKNIFLSEKQTKQQLLEQREKLIQTENLADRQAQLKQILTQMDEKLFIEKQRHLYFRQQTDMFMKETVHPLFIEFIVENKKLEDQISILTEKIRNLTN